MKRNSGEWLRERIVDRVVPAGLHGMVGLGWMLGAGFVLWVTRGPGPVPEWMVWSMPLPSAVLLGAALFTAKRELREEARAEGGDSRIARNVWRLAKREDG